MLRKTAPLGFLVALSVFTTDVTDDGEQEIKKNQKKK